MSAKPCAIASSISWTLTSSQAQTIAFSLSDTRAPRDLAGRDGRLAGYRARREQPGNAGASLLVGLHREALAVEPGAGAGAAGQLVQGRGRQRDRYRVTADAGAVPGVDGLHRIAQGPSRNAADQDDVVAALAERFRAALLFIAVADHRELPADLGAESQKAAGGIDTRPVDAGKRQGLRHSAGGDDHAPGDDRQDAVAVAHGQERVSRDLGVVRVEAHALRIEQQAGPPGALLGPGPEEQRRASGPRLALDQQRLRSGGARSGETGRAAADDGQVDHAQLAANRTGDPTGQLA